ncbi:MAG: hypothetical protein IPM76_17615 [Chloroflexi bacterium]|nr:hypothetical protein [Chloroflexota bacterium]
MRQVEVDGWFFTAAGGFARGGAFCLRGAFTRGGFLLLREPVPPRCCLARASALRGAVFWDELVEVVFLLEHSSNVPVAL